MKKHFEKNTKNLDKVDKKTILGKFGFPIEIHISKSFFDQTGIKEMCRFIRKSRTFQNIIEL